MNSITILGLSILFFYSLIQVFNFYGIDQSVYVIYILFYLFLILCIMILPNEIL
jgi:hypothetical protein